MSYIQFNPTKLSNLDFTMKREILRSNRAGSYISTTLNSCNTRKYHGLLVCPIDSLDGEKHVLLSALDETVILQGSKFNLGIRRYQGGYMEPKGHKYIQNFEIDRIPKTTFKVGGVILTKERTLVEKQQQMIIRYTLEESKSPIILRFRPFLAFRNIHQLSKSNLYANTKYETANNGISMQLYDGYPHLYMQFSREAEFVAAPDWHYNIEYIKEKNRGYEYLEDLFTPGYFEISLKKDETIIFSASTTEVAPELLKQNFTKEVNKRISRACFMDVLTNASQQFIKYKTGSVDIIAGFPWYGSISRQTFIALPGLRLTHPNKKLSIEVIETYLPHLNKGLFPHSIETAVPVYDSADASLWFIWSLQQLKKCGYRSREIWTSFGAAIKEILENYRLGTPIVNMLESGLLFAADEQIALTWMDSYSNGRPVVPRWGKPVELNALWYNAICFALELARNMGDAEFVQEWRKMPEKVAEAFMATYWDEEKGFLADSPNSVYTEWAVRPNMVIAAALDFTPLTIEQRKQIISIAKHQLLTPRGLRSLSPEHPAYKGTVEGNIQQREEAAHQGAAWPWLIQFFVEGYLKIHKKSGIPFVKKIIHGFEDEMTEHCIGTISEMYNGNPPHQAKGAVSQAWNVAALVYALHLVEELEKT